MFKKSSRKPRKSSNNRRRFLLQILVILLLASTVLIGCRTTEPEAQIDNGQIIKNMAPDLPELPKWPQLTWTYQDGLYCLNEADVDKILDYWENRIPGYLRDLEIYKSKLSIVLDHL